MPKLFLHHIDIVNDRYVSGWCFNRVIPQVAVTLQILGNGKRLGQIRCDQPRKDVKKAGLHKNGQCGFMFLFPTGALQADTSLTFAVKGFPGKLNNIDATQIEPVLTNSPPLFFMHIPKTAGTSFNNHVQRWFGADQWHIHTETYAEEQLHALATPGSYLAGHLPLYKIKKIFPDTTELRLHALLRDPLAQLHSHLAWIKGIGLHSESDFFNSHPPAVRALALKLQHHELTTPEQLTNFIGQLDGFEWDFFDNIQTRYFLSERPDKVTAANAEEAINNLSLFSAVGLTEKYDQFLKIIAKQYGRRSQYQSSQHNKTKVAPLFDLGSNAVRDALNPLIRFDQQLYDKVAQSH